MAGYSWSVAIFFLQFVTVSVSSQYFPNHKYEHESDLSFNRETDQKQRDRLALDFNQIKYPPIYFPSQLHSPLQEDQLANEIKLKPQDAERKLTIHDDHEYTPKTSALKDKRIYENFVTPKEESSLKRYEVTTKKFIDTDPASLTSSAVGLDNDVAIALDDNEDIDDGVVQPESSRPEHLNPLVYLDSYGRLHGKGQSPRVAGQGFGYGVLHPKTSPRHLYSKKATGRVRMQVFRGPTRIVGHKRYAPWGYFVVQPADNYGPHHYPGPPYYR